MKKFTLNVIILFIYLFFLGVFNFFLFTTDGTLKLIGLFAMMLFCINRIVMTIKDFFDEMPNKFERYSDIFLAVVGIIIFYIVLLNLFFESSNILALLVSFMYLFVVITIIVILVKKLQKDNKK